MNIQEFLNKNKITGMTKEVTISDRICDEKGIPFKFKIKTITSKDYEELRDKNTKLNAVNGILEFKSNDFYIDLITKCCTEPNFKDKASLDAVGAVTPDEYINSVLLAGEIEFLAKKIGEINGYKPFNELVEEAKN